MGNTVVVKKCGEHEVVRYSFKLRQKQTVELTHPKFGIRVIRESGNRFTLEVAPPELAEGQDVQEKVSPGGIILLPKSGVDP